MISALERLNNLYSESAHTLLVVDDSGKLIGTVTDGDVRRAILNGLTTGAPVSSVMNPKPLVLNGDQLKNKKVVQEAVEKSIHLIPIIDENHLLIDYILPKKDQVDPVRPNKVVILAGGLGTRLRPLTNDCPKPLLKLNSKPILERIVESLKGQGFRHFFFAVNYKAKMLQDYFKDGSHFGVKISYLIEKEPLGTAGALSLLPESTDGSPVVVMNGDILTKVDLSNVLKFHSEHKSRATMCVNEYEHRVPYGVVHIGNNYEIQDIEEKPSINLLVNAGIYVINPDLLQLIPKNHYFDMPSLFEAVKVKQFQTAVYPLKEYWLDIGNKDDFERAQEEVSHEFDVKKV